MMHRRQRTYGYILTTAFLVLAGIAVSAQPSSPFASGTWLKLGVRSTGIYKIDATTVPAISGNRVSDIAIFGGDGAMLSEDNAVAPTYGLKEMSAWVHDANHDGIIGTGDYILFYAEGPVVWRYDVQYNRDVHLTHSYANTNYVYLCTDRGQGRRITATATPTAEGADITTYTAHTLYERDLTNTHNSGRIWVGEKFSSSTPHRSFTLTLPSPVVGNTTSVRVGLASVSNRSSSFTATLNGTPQTLYFDGVTPYGVLTYNYLAGSSATQSIDLDYQCSESQAAGYLDFIEISAEIPLQYGGSQITFSNDSHIGEDNVSRFVISQAPASLRVWDVTDIDSVVEMPLTTTSGNASFTASTHERRTYTVFDGNTFLAPSSVETLPRQDISGAENPDLVIVTHAAYRQQAARLAGLHEVIDGMNTLVVTQEEVFNEFSSGKPDPMAIRAMLRMFAHRADSTHPHPRYLLLLGKGTYDNRNILGLNQTTVITYQSATSFTDDSYATVSDDPLGYLGDNESGLTGNDLDVSIGRLPAKSVAEANLMVEKIEHYMTLRDMEDASIRGDWRNYVALLSDDADPSSPGDIDFAQSSEHTANLINEQHPWINVDKIYADAYRQQSGTIGSYYPDVNNALKQRINYGCLLLNYIGHGSDQYIGTERYMELSDISSYTNTDRLPFFVTSTCSFGKYDRTDGVCGAEAFLLARAAGVGVIAAARPISHIQTFNTSVVLNALDRRNSIGDALRKAKNAHPMTQNRSITLLGDPALHLSFPKYQVVVTAINGVPLRDGVADSAQVLSRVTIEGEIRDADGTLQNDFTGLIFPLVFDRQTQCRTLANDNAGTEVDFTQQKNVLYKGCDSVRNGHFSYSFVVPRDVDYQFGRAKLSHYARSASDNATGSYDNIYFGGFDESVVLSETRPEIRLYMGDTNFRNGGLVDCNPTLLAVLQDSAGINSVGSGLGHDIVATLDGNANSIIELNDFYETDLVNPRRGFVTYQLEQLTPGCHTLTLKAWNIFNYSNTATIAFTVRSADTAAIGRFYSYPNPARDCATIHIEHNIPSTVVSAVVDIYDMQGQRVRRLTPAVADGSYVVGPVVWDFRDESGATMAGSIYAARVLLTTADKQTVTAVTKIIKIK